MPSVKLIITDLDGTFTPNKYDISQENAAAVRMAQQNGILVCACTARNWALAKGQVRRAGFAPYTITSNGASIVDNKSGLPKIRARIASEDVEALLNIGVCAGACVTVYTNEQILFLDGFAARHYASFPSHWETVERDLAIPVTRCKSVLEMAVLSAESAELVEFIHPGDMQMDQKALDIMRRFSVSGLGGHCTFIMQTGVTKLQGVRELMHMLGVSQENLMAIGDGANDQDMLRFANMGVAMGNASESTKDAADIVAPPCEQNGFAWAVDKAIIGV